MSIGGGTRGQVIGQLTCTVSEISSGLFELHHFFLGSGCEGVGEERGHLSVTGV